MEILYIAQVFFYFTFSFAIIFIGVMIGVISYKILKTISNVKKIVDGIEAASHNLISKINGTIDSFSLPTIFTFIKEKMQSKKKSKKVDKSKEKEQ